METYPIDIDAAQIVRWLIDERRRGASHLNVFATRSYAVEALDENERQHLDTEDEGDLDDILAVGTLEVHPAADRNGWVLRVRVEDRLGPRLPEDEGAPEDEEEIDLEAFEAEFIRPQRGTVDVSLDAEDEAARARFAQVFGHMLRNEHRAARR
jgi:hypothetical protein